MLAPSQIAIRSTGIGSSEIAAICGLSFWGDGPHKVYLAKRGLVSAQAPTIATRLGDVMERLIGSEYEHETDIPIVPLLDLQGYPATLAHPEHKWALASVDRVRVSDWIPVEIKLITGERAHYFRGHERCDWCGRIESLHWRHEPAGVPDDVAVQVQWQMLVTGAPWAHVCRFWAARGGPDFRIHTLERNEKIIAYLLREGHRFWHEHVIPGVPPDPDSSSYSEECERLTHANVLKGMANAPDGTEVHVEDFLRGDKLIREGEELKSRAANWLRRIVGFNEGIVGPWYRVTNRARKDGVRVLKVKDERSDR